MKGHPLSDEQIKAILRLYDEDCSTQEIAARVGVDISTVQKRLVRAGKAPPSQRLTQEKRGKNLSDVQGRAISPGNLRGSGMF